MRIVILIIFTITTSNLYSWKLVDYLYNGFSETMIKCPERIWPDYDWSNATVFLILSSKNITWQWSKDYQGISRINKPNVIKNGAHLFSFLEYEQMPSMTLNLDKLESPREMLMTGIHEYFHNQGQKNWAVNKSTRLRGTPYPYTAKPRLYRKMLYDHLRNYLISSNTQELQRAKHWFNMWKENYPYEYKNSTTDSTEGTATYVETIALAISSLKCSASESSIKEKVINLALNPGSLSILSKPQAPISLGLESYALGGLSSVILRFMPDIPLTDWSKRVIQGESPLDILFSFVDDEQEEFLPPPYLQQFERKVSEENKKLAPLLDQDIENWSNPEYIRVSAPTNWLDDTLSPETNVLVKSIEKQIYLLAKEHHFSNSPSSRYTLEAHSLLFKDTNSPCSSVSDTFTLVHKDLVQESEESLFVIKSSSLNGKLKGFKLETTNSFSYLCPNKSM